MSVPIVRRAPSRRSLAMQRTALLTRIHVAREETAEAGRRVATDLQAVDRSRLSIQAGLQIFKASVVAAGVIWSLKASSPIGRGSRLFTTVFSLLSTIRAMHKIRAFLMPLAPSPQRQE